MTVIQILDTDEKWNICEFDRVLKVKVRTVRNKFNTKCVRTVKSMLSGFLWVNMFNNINLRQRFRCKDESFLSVSKSQRFDVHWDRLTVANHYISYES